MEYLAVRFLRVVTRYERNAPKVMIIGYKKVHRLFQPRTKTKSIKDSVGEATEVTIYFKFTTETDKVITKAILEVFPT